MTLVLLIIASPPDALSTCILISAGIFRAMASGSPEPSPACLIADGTSNPVRHGEANQEKSQDKHDG
jgi:hypothetical protein